MDELPFKVVRSNSHAEVLERSTNVLMARAAFEKAVELYPNDVILLQHGARIIAKSSELDPTPGRARQATIDNYLALVASLKLVREALEDSFGAAAELPASEQFETLPHECQAIAEAIRKAGAEFQRRQPR
jgi:hypothetical protein